jgi:hypothetical protein
MTIPPGDQRDLEVTFALDPCPTRVQSKRIVIQTDERGNETRAIPVEFHVGNRATPDRLPPGSHTDRKPGRGIARGMIGQVR